MIFVKSLLYNKVYLDETISSFSSFCILLSSYFALQYIDHIFLAKTDLLD